MAGKIVHFELHAADVDRAAGFWNGLFNWKIGGSAMMPVPTHGWFAACTDTKGTNFSLWQTDDSAA